MSVTAARRRCRLNAALPEWLPQTSIPLVFGHIRQNVNQFSGRDRSCFAVKVKVLLIQVSEKKAHALLTEIFRAMKAGADGWWMGGSRSVIDAPPDTETSTV